MKFFRYFWPKFVNTTCIERIGVNKLTELIDSFCKPFRNFYLFFAFSREKNFSNNVWLPRAKCVCFQPFYVALVVLQVCCHAEFWNKTRILFFFQISMLEELSTLILQKQSIFLLKLHSCLFWIFEHQKVLVNINRRVQMRKQQQFLSQFVLQNKKHVLWSKVFRSILSPHFLTQKFRSL